MPQCQWQKLYTNSRACSIKLIMGLIYFEHWYGELFVISSNFYPILEFQSKARSLPYKGLLRYIITDGRKSFIVVPPVLNVLKN
jgi:hypothetical protein